VSSIRFFLGVACLSVTPVCANEPAIPREKGNLAIQARGVLIQYCGKCHTGRQAPGESLLKLAQHSAVVAKGPPIPFATPSDPERSLILKLVMEGSMPPGGLPRPSPSEIEALRAWVKAGAPSYPVAFDDMATARALLDDLDSLDAQTRANVPYFRYISLAHLIQDDVALPDLRKAEWRLSQSLLDASGQPVTPVPVNDTATLFRIDLRELGWDTRDLFEEVDAPAGALVPNLTPFDLILLEYPFGFRLPADTPESIRLDSFLTKAAQIRPVPFIRGDWLADALFRDRIRQPLAEDLKSLDKLAKWARRKGEDEPPRKPKGPVYRPLLPADPLRVAIPAQPGQAIPILPFGSWYARDVVPEPVPFKLSAEVVDANGRQKVNQVKRDQGFMIKVSTDRDIYLFVILVMADGSAKLQPLDGGSVKGGLMVKAQEPKFLLADTANPFRLTSFSTDRTTEEEYFLLFAATEPVTAPIMLKSKHAEPKIWRFIPDQSKGPDQAKMIRTVLPITLRQ